jgi:hypothetical protein
MRRFAGRSARRLLQAGAVALALVAALTVTATNPRAYADNRRLNNSVVINVYTIQHRAGCTTDVKINPQLQLAAQQHTDDVLNNRELDGDIGSDGSTAQDRANAAGFHGKVAETVAINPALAISGIEILNQWYYNPAYLAIMQDCGNTLMGVWSENSLDRTVVVAVYGQPTDPSTTGFSPSDPSPDYDASDELEYGMAWFPWILRGVFPPPAYPPN